MVPVGAGLGLPGSTSVPPARPPKTDYINLHREVEEATAKHLRSQHKRPQNRLQRAACNALREKQLESLAAAEAEAARLRHAAVVVHRQAVRAGNDKVENDSAWERLWEDDSFRLDLGDVLLKWMRTFNGRLSPNQPCKVPRTAASIPLSITEKEELHRLDLQHCRRQRALVRKALRAHSPGSSSRKRA